MTHSRSTSWSRRSRIETRTCNFREGRIFAYFTNLFFFFASNWSDRINTRNLGAGRSNPYPLSPAHARRHASQPKGLTISVRSCTSLQAHFDVPIQSTKSFNCEWFEILMLVITHVSEKWYLTAGSCCLLLHGLKTFPILIVDLISYRALLWFESRK